MNKICPDCNAPLCTYPNGKYAMDVCWNCGHYASDSPAFYSAPKMFEDLVRSKPQQFIQKYLVQQPLADDSYHEPRNRRRVNGTEKSYSLNIKSYKNKIKCKVNLYGFKRVLHTLTICFNGLSVCCSTFNLPIRILRQG